MSRPLTLTALLLVSAAWLAALAVTPGASARWGRGGAQFAAAMYVAGSLVCHQRPERSFHLDGAQLPVCARCAGLYAGVSLGVLGWMGLAGIGRRASSRARFWTARVRTVVIVMAVPTLVTVVTAWLGFWDPGNVVRAVFALPLGAVAGGLVTAVSARDLE